MTTTFYLVRGFSMGVTPVEVDRFTESSVWTTFAGYKNARSRRSARVGRWEIYFEMEGAAWDHLVRRCTDEVEELERSLKLAQDNLVAVSASRAKWMQSTL